jgi:hypothetical protein
MAPSEFDKVLPDSTDTLTPPRDGPLGLSPRPVSPFDWVLGGQLLLHSAVTNLVPAFTILALNVICCML